MVQQLEPRCLMAAASHDFAVDDAYTAQADQVLVVPAAGVLANDLGGPATDDVLPGFYVAADGVATGDGSFQRPWKLADVLRSPPASIRPGDVIWLRGGTYHGQFQSNLTGTADAPITVRGYPGEHARIDLNNPFGESQGFFIDGDHGVYRDFEVMSSAPGPRISDEPGPFQQDVTRGGVSVRGDHNRLINLVVHDMNAGIGHWGDGGEVYGTISYNNGWTGPDRQHGHGLYLQNETGPKWIAENIVFNQFGVGIHAYGSRNAALNDLNFEGNVVFNNGAAVGVGFLPQRDLLVGGGTKVSNATLHQNFSFQDKLNGTIDVGYLWGEENDDIRITDNYFASPVRFLKGFDDVTFSGNTIVAVDQPVTLVKPGDGVTSDYVWDHNRYVNEDQLRFDFEGGKTFDQWRSVTGFDRASEAVIAAPTTEVFVRPNAYETGRANVIVYNWQELPSVQVDLSSVLTVGQRFEFRTATDVFGAPILSGTYQGTAIELPMVPRAAPSPIGYAGAAPVGTDARFGVFVVTTPQANAAPNQLAVIGFDAQSVLGASVQIDAGGRLVYDPSTSHWLRALPQGYTLRDQFTYTLRDGQGRVDTATVYVSTAGRNDPPRADNDWVTTAADQSITIDVLANDQDPDWLDELDVIRIDATGTRGTVTMHGNLVRYNPAGKFDGLVRGQAATDTFSYTTVDRGGLESTATVAITVSGAATSNPTSPNPTSASRGLVAHWALNETSGTIAADQSGYQHSATVMGDPDWQSGTLALDGSGDYLAAGPGPAIEGIGGFSVAAWVRTSKVGERVIVEQSGLDANGRYRLSVMSSGRLRFWTFGQHRYGPNIQSTTAIRDGQWHHVAAVRELDGTTKIYIDGRLDVAKAGAPEALRPNQVTIGAGSSNLNNTFDGSLDDVRIYDRALGAAEVSTLFHNTQPPAAGPAAVAAAMSAMFRESVPAAFGQQAIAATDRVWSEPLEVNLIDPWRF